MGMGLWDYAPILPVRAYASKQEPIKIFVLLSLHFFFEEAFMDDGQGTMDGRRWTLWTLWTWTIDFDGQADR